MGLTVAIVDKSPERKIIDRKVVTRGVVTDILQLRPGSWFRATIKPDNRTMWFIYSGKPDWAWVNELTLIKKGARRGQVRP